MRGSVCLLTLALCACTRPPRSSSRPDPRGGLDAIEAPSLHDRVAAGTLPPLAQRLPEHPLVVTPYESPGLYGGTWHMMEHDPDLHIFRVAGGYTPLIRWASDSKGLVPGTAESWEQSEDGTALTIHLRKGLRWSDGEPFTAEDIAYWAEIANAGDTKLDAPFWTLVGGKQMHVETPDPWTVVMRFAGPNWYAPLYLGTHVEWSNEYDMPKHYLKRFDPRYNPAYKDYETFDRMNRSTSNPDLPVLWPWKLARIERGNRFVLERNPFYYATDTLGRQLPYIDEIDDELVDDKELRTLKLLSGEIDAQFRTISLDEYHLLAGGRARGGYRILRWAEALGARAAFVLNDWPPDPVLRGIVRDPRFRKALSLAVDREKINQMCFRGLGRPQAATISRESWHFATPEGAALFDEWSRESAAFDLPRANALLDEMGLTARDADGVRLRPDGAPLTILIDKVNDTAAGIVTDEAQIVSDGWTALGLHPVVKDWPSGAVGQRMSLGTFTVTVDTEAEMDLFTFPDWVFPVSDNYWHPLVGKWYETGGKEGVAPEGPEAELLDLYAKIQQEPDLAKAHAIVLDAIRIHMKEGPFVIGTVGGLPSLVVVRNDFRNVPEDPRVLGAWAVAQPATSFPETFFFSSSSGEPARP